MPTHQHTTFNRLVRIQIMLWNACNIRIREQTGLPLARIEVLRTVQAIDHCRVNDIAEHLLITVGAASKLVDRLQASGHILRRPNPADSRSSIVTLTQNGQCVIQQVNSGIKPLLQAYFNNIDLPCLNDNLDLIEQNIISLSEHK